MNADPELLAKLRQKAAVKAAAAAVAARGLIQGGVNVSCSRKKKALCVSLATGPRAAAGARPVY